MKLSKGFILFGFLYFLFLVNASNVLAVVPGDANGDGKVDGIDFTIWLFRYGQNASGPQNGDFNNDGRVDGVDYSLWLSNYGKVYVTSTVSPTTTFYPTPTPSIVQTKGVWISREEIANLPITGPEWQSLLSTANSSWGSADISNQDSNHDVYTLSGALVCARIGQLCDKTKQALLSAIGTENGSRWLAIGRNMVSYTIAADLLRSNQTLSGSELDRVTTWLSSFLTRQLPNNNTGVLEKLTPFDSGSNASAEEGAVYAAIASYNKNKTALDYVWNRFRLYSCDKTNNPETVIDVKNGFDYGWSSASTLSEACAVNPKGTTKQGYRIDGAIINDMRRGGPFTWPPSYTQYPWVGIDGYIPAALILYRAGYPAFQISDRSVLRTLEYLKYLEDNTTTTWFDGTRSNEDIFIVNKAYGVSFPMNGPTGDGRVVGFTGWTHQNGI